MAASVPRVSKPGEMRRRQPAAARVEPQRGRPGQDPDAVPGPDRVPVLDALGVVPHPVAVDEAGAGPLGDRRASGRRRARARRRSSGPGGVPSRSGQVARTRSWLPPMPPEVTITAWARAARTRRPATRELRPPRAAAARLEHRARARRHGAAVVTISPSTRCRNRSPTRPASTPPRDPPLEGLDDPGPGAPGDVEAGHRVAVPVGQVAAALGPADDREATAPPCRAARTASRRPRSRRRPRPTGAASGPRARSKPARCPSSPARPARASP